MQHCISHTIKFRTFETDNIHGNYSNLLYYGNFYFHSVYAISWRCTVYMSVLDQCHHISHEKFCYDVIYSQISSFICYYFYRKKYETVISVTLFCKIHGIQFCNNDYKSHRLLYISIRLNAISQEYNKRRNLICINLFIYYFN